MIKLPRAIAMTCLIAIACATPLGGSVVSRACAAGSLHVAVVVDGGTNSAVSAVCVPATDRENGAVLLAARARQLGTPEPRYGPSGLLCAIDGIPSSGCGTQHDGRFAYWSYWHGSNGKWTYSNFGPASQRVDPGTVEGWRWQPDGTALPTDPPPRGPARAEAVCVPSAPPATAPPATVAPPHSGGTPTMVRAAASPPASTARAQSPGDTSASALPTTTGPTTNTTKPAPGATTSTTTRAHPATASARASTESSTTIALTKGGIAAAGNADDSGGSGGVPFGLLVGVVLVIGLGAAGAIAQRRRRHRPAS